MSNDNNSVKSLKAIFTNLGVIINRREVGENNIKTAFGGWSISSKGGVRVNGWFIWAGNKEIPVVGLYGSSEVSISSSDEGTVRQLIPQCLRVWKQKLCKDDKKAELSNSVWYNIDLDACEFYVFPMDASQKESIEPRQQIRKLEKPEAIDVKKLTGK